MGGATSSEFQRRSGNIDKDAVDARLAAGFAAANLDAPECIQAVRNAVMS
jgi:hypothetical protein